MAQQKEPAVDTQRVWSGLQEAKERLAGQSEHLSANEYMAKHPYLTLGAAFLSGVFLGGSQGAREEIARVATDLISKIVVLQNQKD